MKLSVKKEKLIVLVGSIMAAVTGYLSTSYPVEAGLMGTVTAAVLVFWSEGVNTESTPPAS